MGVARGLAPWRASRQDHHQALAQPDRDSPLQITRQQSVPDGGSQPMHYHAERGNGKGAQINATTQPAANPFPVGTPVSHDYQKPITTLRQHSKNLQVTTLLSRQL